MKEENSLLISFDKNCNSTIQSFKHEIDDMCCEYCYKGLIECLYECDDIKSVQSNYNYGNTKSNIEFTIEYKKNTSKEEIIDLIIKNK